MSDTQQLSRARSDEQPAYEPAIVVRHLAHELRQPLSTIESIAFYLDLVLPRSEGKARRHLGKLQQEVHRINWILTDALHFLRAARPNLQPLDLSEVVAKSLSEWTSEEGTRVRLDLERALPLVSLDVEQIEHLLRNLLAFFQQVAAPSATMNFRTCRRAGGIAVEVLTTAADCAGEDLRALFEPFEDSMPAGSGLKLASVRRIAEGHGASVEVESGASGEISLAVVFPTAV